MRSISLVLAMAAAAPLVAQPAESASYQITHTYKLGGDGSWD